ncbi:MAG: hypothetical protein HY817_01030 [Candidatus Abawacabacteria bacterium]|nr:hypothetical protein [Candidatus Abawacabacteria bacterium]
MQHNMKKYGKCLLTALVLLGISTNTAFAAAVDDYVNGLRISAIANIRDINARSEVNTRLEALNACLNRDWAGHNGQKNWQYHVGGNEVTTRERLVEVIDNDNNHPCNAEKATLATYLQSIIGQPNVGYPPLIASVRRGALEDGVTQSFGIYYSNEPALKAKFDSYFECLMAEDNGAARWQFGRAAPTTIEELRTRTSASSHPCHRERELLAGHNRGDPVDSSSRANLADSPNRQGRTESPVGPTNTTGSTNSGVDSRPIYQRIVPPSEQDVFAPAFARGSNPSISSFVNFLFDLLVRKLLPWMVAVMVLLITWAGYNYIMAQGDSGKLKQAKDMILYSIIAIVLAVAALSIITILNNILTNAR